MSSLLQRARNAYPDCQLSDREVISLYQKHIRSKVSSDSCRKNGAKGYAALKAAGKEELAGEKAADWRFDHPSDLEQIIIDVLVEMGLPVDRAHREVKVGKFYVDFKYGNIAIEANDDTWHINQYSIRGDVETHDKGKYSYLRNLGVTVIVLAEKAIRSGEAAQLLKEMKASLLEEDAW